MPDRTGADVVGDRHAIRRMQGDALIVAVVDAVAVDQHRSRCHRPCLVEVYWIAAHFILAELFDFHALDRHLIKALHDFDLAAIGGVVAGNRRGKFDVAAHQPHLCPLVDTVIMGYAVVEGRLAGVGGLAAVVVNHQRRLGVESDGAGALSGLLAIDLRDADEFGAIGRRSRCPRQQSTGPAASQPYR